MYDLALTQIPGIGIQTARQLIAYLGSAENIFSTPKQKLVKIPGIGEVVAQNILIHQYVALRWAESEQKRAEKDGATIYSFYHPSFPESLRRIPDCPMVLYSKGDFDFRSRPSIAIVGTRKCTSYGTTVVEKMVHELRTVPDLVVYSGLAYGIDIEAHKQCVQQNVTNVAVLAGGLDRIYPAEHKKYVPQITSNGALITEYAYGTQPLAVYFPKRNRIVAALADVILVVEANISGGALITAELANDYNKEVYAVPGDVYKATSAGCNKLIQQHRARIFTTTAELIEWMQWNTESTVSATKSKNNNIETSILQHENPEIVAVWKELLQPMHLDELAWKVKIEVPKLVSLLLTMEIEGLVVALPGKIYKRK